MCVKSLFLPMCAVPQPSRINLTQRQRTFLFCIIMGLNFFSAVTSFTVRQAVKPNLEFLQTSKRATPLLRPTALGSSAKETQPAIFHTPTTPQSDPSPHSRIATRQLSPSHVQISAFGNVSHPQPLLLPPQKGIAVFQAASAPVSERTVWTFSAETQAVLHDDSADTGNAAPLDIENAYNPSAFSREGPELFESLSGRMATTTTTASGAEGPSNLSASDPVERGCIHGTLIPFDTAKEGIIYSAKPWMRPQYNSTQQLQPNSRVADAHLHIDKPLVDKRAYRSLVLRNGLKVILISDPEADQAASALCVNVGSLHDPREFQGLAHFLEHMLFLGTEKYPDEDDYNKYLAQHGGSSNAMTRPTDTCYFFEVGSRHLSGALDRFAHFFLSPLLTPSAIKREVNAVHSEYMNGRNYDFPRFFHLLQWFANPAHPCHQFTIGNHRTLRDDPLKKGLDLRTALMEFHSTYYSANIMSLAVLGREPLDTLESMVTQKRFSRVRNINAVVPHGIAMGAPELPYRSEDLGYLTHVVGLQDIPTMTFVWILPEQTTYWRSYPLAYIFHILAHEGKGSVLSTLKAEELATDHYCMEYNSAAGIAFALCSLQLTDRAIANPKGLARINALVAQCIRLIRDNEVQDAILDEVIAIHDLSFRYRSMHSPQADVLSIASNLHKYPPEYVLAAQQRIFKRDPGSIKKMLKYFTPENMLVFSTAKQYRSQQERSSQRWETDPYYGTRYWKQPLPPHFWHPWHDTKPDPFMFISSDISNSPSIQFPQLNRFIPKDLALRFTSLGNRSQLPFKLPFRENFHFSPHIYFKHDTSYGLPKASVFFRFTSPYIYSGLRQLCLVDLYLRAAARALTEFAYDAKLVHLNFKLRMSHDSRANGDVSGFEILIEGYNDAIPSLLKAICTQLAKNTLTREKVLEALITQLRSLQNTAEHNQPYHQAAEEATRLIRQPYYPAHQRFAVMKTLSVDDVLMMNPLETFLKDVFLEGLIEGNLLSHEATNLVSLLNSVLYSEATQPPRPVSPSPHFCVNRVAQLLNLPGVPNPARLKVSIPVAFPEEQNNGVNFVVHLGRLCIDEVAYLNLVYTYLDQPFFDSLRTRQQLGYYVRVLKTNILDSRALLFQVQSQCVSPTDIIARIEGFIEHYVENAASILTRDAFEELKNSVITRIDQHPKSLEEQFHQDVMEITYRRHVFDYKERLIKTLKLTTLNGLLSFMQKKILMSPWLVVQAVSHLPPTPKQPPTETEDLGVMQDSTSTGQVETSVCHTSATAELLHPSKPAVWHLVSSKAIEFFGNSSTTSKFTVPGFSNNLTALC